MWHGLVKGLPKKGILYAYKVEGEGGWEQGHRWDATKLCLDPYAPLIEGRRRFGQRDEVEQYRPKVWLAWVLSEIMARAGEHQREAEMQDVACRT